MCSMLMGRPELDVNAQNAAAHQHSYTPLLTAAYKGNVLWVGALLERPELLLLLPNVRSETAYDLATVAFSHPRVAGQLRAETERRGAAWVAAVAAVVEGAAAPRLPSKTAWSGPLSLWHPPADVDTTEAVSFALCRCADRPTPISPTPTRSAPPPPPPPRTSSTRFTTHGATGPRCSGRWGGATSHSPTPCWLSSPAAASTSTPARATARRRSWRPRSRTSTRRRWCRSCSRRAARTPTWAGGGPRRPSRRPPGCSTWASSKPYFPPGRYRRRSPGRRPASARPRGATSWPCGSAPC